MLFFPQYLEKGQSDRKSRPHSVMLFRLMCLIIADTFRYSRLVKSAGLRQTQFCFLATMWPGAIYNLSQQTPYSLPSRRREYSVSLLDILRNNLMHLKFLGHNCWPIRAADHHFIMTFKQLSMMYTDWRLLSNSLQTSGFLSQYFK